MSKTAKTTFLLMVVTMVSKVLGLVRESVLASVYGTGMYKAAYDTANNIPVVIFAIVGTALATTLIPLYQKVKSENGEKKAYDFINTVVNITIIICIILSIIGVVFAKPIVKIFAMGYTGDTLFYAIKFTRILLPTIIFVGLANIFTGFLQVKNNFTIPGLIGIPYSIILIISIFISEKTSIYVLVIGTFLAITSKALFQIPFIKKEGYKYSPVIKTNDPIILEMLKLTVPVIIGVGAIQINTIIDKSLASTLGVNIVSSFTYAMRLYEFVQALFVTTLLAVVYPKMSEFMANKNIKLFKISLSKTINILLVILIPVAAGVCSLGVPIVELLFQRNKFTVEDTIITANILNIYIFGMIAFSIRDIISRAFYSLQDSKTPMINSFIAIIINIVLNVILVRILGYKGLALATVISSYVGLILFIRSLRKKIGSIGFKRVISVALKSTVASVLMGICTSAIYYKIHLFLSQSFVSDIFNLGISIGLGMLIYVVIMYFMKVEELVQILNIIKLKLKNIKNNLQL